MKIKIFADAASNLFKYILKEKNADIKVMNMVLTIADKEYNCYDDEIDVRDFSKTYYTKMKEGEKVRTSLVSPGQYIEAFRKEVEQGNRVLAFTMAKGISGTYQSACLARDEINKEFKGEYVYVIDSMTAGLGEGMQALRAYELTKTDISFARLIEECERYKRYVRSEFTVNDIRFLLNTGRVKKYLAKFVNLLNIKVLLKRNDESKIALAGSSIGRTSSIKKLAKWAIDRYDGSQYKTIFITHCNVIEDANKLKTMLVKGGIDPSVIEIYEYDLISGAHIGPESLAIFYTSNEPY